MLTQMPLTPIAVNYTCDVCGIGAMEQHHVEGVSYHLTARETNPPQFPHVCNNCGHEQSFSVAFPLLRYAKAGEELDLTQLDV